MRQGRGRMGWCTHIPLRARRRSFFFSFGMSTSDCVPVMLCTVVIMPFSIVSFSWITLMMGAMQLVVQEAALRVVSGGAEITWDQMGWASVGWDGIRCDGIGCDGIRRDGCALRQRHPNPRALRHPNPVWAHVQMVCDSLSLSSLHPMTTFSTLGSLTGADTTTRFTPHRSRYGVRLATVRNLARTNRVAVVVWLSGRGAAGRESATS